MSQAFATSVTNHPLCEEILRLAAPLNQKLFARGSMFEVAPRPIRSVTQRELYLMGCGFSMSHLITLAQQLDHIPAYVRGYSRSAGMRKVDVTRAADLTYHIENFIIRIASLEDRVLLLVEACFDLGLRPRDVRFHLVRHNAHVAGTRVSTALDRLRKTTQTITPDRHRIIHRHSYMTPALRRIEFWLLAARLNSGGSSAKRFAKGQYLTEIRKFLAEWSPEAQQRIDSLAQATKGVCDELMPVFRDRLPAI